MLANGCGQLLLHIGWQTNLFINLNAFVSDLVSGPWYSIEFCVLMNCVRLAGWIDVS